MKTLLLLFLGEIECCIYLGFLSFKNTIIGVELIYSIVLVSGVPVKWINYTNTIPSKKKYTHTHTQIAWFLTKQVLEFSFFLVKMDTAMCKVIISSLRTLFKSKFVSLKIEMLVLWRKHQLGSFSTCYFANQQFCFLYHQLVINLGYKCHYHNWAAVFLSFSRRHYARCWVCVEYA